MMAKPHMPRALQEALVSLRRYGVDESAIPMVLAPEMCRYLSSAQRAVLGGDFWTVIGDDLELAYQPWAMRAKEPTETWDRYVAESVAAARSALRARAEYFRGQTVFVAFTSCSEDEHRDLDTINSL